MSPSLCKMVCNCAAGGGGTGAGASGLGDAAWPVQTPPHGLEPQAALGRGDALRPAGRWPKAGPSLRACCVFPSSKWVSHTWGSQGMQFGVHMRASPVCTGGRQARVPLWDGHLGVRVLPCVQEVVADLLGIPTTGGQSPETCASGPRGLGGAAGGRQETVLAAGGPVARAVGSASPQTWRSAWLFLHTPPHTPTHVQGAPESPSNLAR